MRIYHSRQSAFLWLEGLSLTVGKHFDFHFCCCETDFRSVLSPWFKYARKPWKFYSRNKSKPYEVNFHTINLYKKLNSTYSRGNNHPEPHKPNTQITNTQCTHTTRAHNEIHTMSLILHPLVCSIYYISYVFPAAFLHNSTC